MLANARAASSRFDTTFIAATSIVAALISISALACGGGRRGGDAPAPRVLVEIDLEEPPRESAEPSLVAASTPTLLEVIQEIDRARSDPNTGGLFLRIGGLEGAWGRSGDLMEALHAVREAGKPVHCHLEMADNLGYALAARVCDRLSMTPAGMIDAVGVAAHVFYARRLLESIGLTAEVMQVGRFKGAGEPFTRDDMSPEMRESLGMLVDDLHAHLLDALVEGRGLTRDEAQAALDAGPYDSGRARRARLIDAIAYDDEARSLAREAARADRIERARFDQDRQPFDLEALVASFAAEREIGEPEGARVELVHVDGTILDGDEPTGARSRPFVRHMRAIAGDADVRAVVLRIDSPGGSALASDLMWHAVRRVARQKPVIVSLGDTAASGGYYIACAGTEIVAHPTTTLGSIGVVGGKVDASPLLGRIGVHVEELRRGAHAGWTSPARGLSEGEREALQTSMRSTYDRFVRRVAEGRRLERAEVEALAEGRIWSGRRGLSLRLIDRFGGLSTALRLARERAELPPDAPTVVWPRERNLLELVAQSLGGSSQERAEAFVRGVARRFGPYESALGMAEILGGREHVALALPFALDAR